MPAAIPFFIAFAAKAVIVSELAVFLITVTSSIAVNAVMASKARRKARDAYNASLKDRLVMTSVTDGARSRIYGRARNVDGVLFKATHGTKSEFYTMFIALAGHEVADIETVYFNDVALTLDGNGYVQTEPYLNVNKTTANQTVTLTGSATQAVTLSYTPIAGSISVYTPGTGSSGSLGDAPSDNYTPTVFYDYTTSGTTVTINGAAAPGASATITYQRSKGNPYARVRKYLGAYSQDVSGDLHALVPALIVVGTHRFQGIAGLLCTFEYNPDAYPLGVPAVSAVVKGAKVYDPRNLLAPPAWSENNSLCAYDWVRYDYGGALIDDEILTSSFSVAANACDVSATFATIQNDVPANVVGARYTCGTVIKLEAGADAPLDSLVESMAGNFGWSGGRLKVRAGAWSAAVATITEDWVSDSGSIDIVSSTATQDTVNLLRPTIADSTLDYVIVPQPEVRAEAYISSDGQELPLELEMRSVTTPYRALDVCEVQLLESRQALSCEMTCKFHAYTLELFDIVYVTLPHYGWAAKSFEVLGWNLTLEGGVRLSLRESVAATYDVATLFTLNDIADNTELPQPWFVEVPVGIGISSVVSLSTDSQLVTRTLVTWTPLTTEAVQQSGKIEVQWAGIGLAPTTTYWTNNSAATATWQNYFGLLQEWFTEHAATLSETDWATQSEPGNTSSTTIVGLRAGYGYFFRIRAVTLVARGAWSVMKSHLIPTISASDASASAAAVAAAIEAAEAAARAESAASAALAGVAAAIAAADAATIAADAATASITSLSSDNLLSAVEKLQVIQQYNAILAEQTGIDAQATAYGVTTQKTTYDAAITSLTAYLGGLTSPTAWNNAAGDTTIVGTTFRTNFVNVYTARSVLLNKIAEIAGTRAAWATVSGVPYASIYANDDAVALGFNPAFAAWTGTYPDGWVVWLGAAPTKETVLVRAGPYAARWAVAGGSVGMLAQSTWTTSPMGVGTFLAGSVDLQLVARTSGLPGFVVDLFTNASLSTYVSTVVQPPSAGTGAWQRIPFIARVGAVENIYGVRITLMASNPAFSSGAFTGTVVFDNLRLAFFDQSIDNTKITIASNGALSGAGGGQVTISGLGYIGELNATYGASASNFTGRVGAGNLVPYSAFREDTNANGLADGWAVYNTTAGPEPVTPSRLAGGGLFGTDSQILTWSVNNTGGKGLTPAAGIVGGAWEASQTYIVSWYAKASGTNLGKLMGLYWDTAPTTVTALNNPALTAAFQRYAFRVAWGASVQAAGGFNASIATGSLSQGTLTFSAVSVTKGDVLTEYMEAVEDVRLAAIDAQTTADQAAADAAAALAAIGVAVSDGVLTPDEKKEIVRNVQVILNEQAGLDAEAAAHAITTQRTAYNTAITTLTGYLATLTAPVAWNNLTGSTTVVGATFNARFNDVYVAKQVLLNAIANKSKTLADAAQSTANGAVSAAAAAQLTANNSQTAATNAQNSATTANTAIADMSSDNVLTPVEKPTLIADYADILAEQSGIGAEATARGLAAQKTAYDNSITALTAYLATLTAPVAWNSLSGNTTIVGATLRTNFSNVYLNRQLLLNSVVSYDLARANTAQASAASATSTANAATTTANNAVTAAGNAQTAANTANADIANMVSDNVLSQVEKPTLIQDYSVITTEQAGIDAQATSHSITAEKTAYDNAVAALTVYLNTNATTPVAWNNLSGITNVVGATLRTNFALVYTTRQTVLNAIATKDLAVANQGVQDAALAASAAAAAQLTATAAQTAANNAQTAATAASNAASAANTAIANMAADNVLTPVEKPALIQQQTVVAGEQTGIDAQATSYGITTEKTAYDNAVIALNNYLATLNAPVLWNNLSGNTNVDGPTLRSRFATVYSTRQVLLNKIYDTARTLANAAQSTANGAAAAAAAAQTTANNAATAASTAQTAANTANTAIANISSDNILSKGEKQQTMIDLNALVNERGGIVSQGNAYGLTAEVGGYNTYLDALIAYLSTWYSDVTTDTVIVGTTYRQRWADAYTYRQVLLNKIYETARVLANAAQSTANAAQTAASNAQTAASNAQTSANTANTAIAAIANDNILSRGEKSAVILDYDAIIAEKSGIDAQATAYGITTEKTSYDNAVSVLTTYLGGLSGWNNTTVDTAIVGNDFRFAFSNVYFTRQVLLNKIAEKAGQYALWDGVVGRPSNAQIINNLLDPNTWVLGSAGSQPGFPQSPCSSGGGNSIVLATLPDGSEGVVWRASSGSAPGNSGEGGWDTNNVTVDPTKTYRYRVWIKCWGATSGSVYFGPGNGQVYLCGTTTSSNYYFESGVSRGALPSGVWALWVGYVYGSSYVGADLGRGGVWNGTTGIKIATGQDFKAIPGNTIAYNRAYQYATNGTGNYQDFWAPAIELCDGSEKPIDQILAGAQRQTGQIAPQAATEVLPTAYVASGPMINLEAVALFIEYTPTVECDIELSANWRITTFLNQSVSKGVCLRVRNFSTFAVLQQSPWCGATAAALANQEMHQSTFMTYRAMAGVKLYLEVHTLSGSVLTVGSIKDVTLKAIVIKR